LAEEPGIPEGEDQGCVDTSLLPTKYPFPIPNPLVSPVTSLLG
jgi:hypothetical protein